MGVSSLVLEISLLSKTAKFPFLTMDYSPWSSKNLINRNRFKKFMQVGIDVTYIYTNFGGCGLFGFGDIATFKKMAKFPILTIDWLISSPQNTVILIAGPYSLSVVN